MKQFILLMLVLTTMNMSMQSFAKDHKMHPNTNQSCQSCGCN